jgi:hypothetical protein
MLAEIPLCGGVVAGVRAPQIMQKMACASLRTPHCEQNKPVLLMTVLWLALSITKQRWGLVRRPGSLSHWFRSDWGKAPLRHSQGVLYKPPDASAVQLKHWQLSRISVTHFRISYAFLC